MVKISVITGSSASGLACLKALLSKAHQQQSSQSTTKKPPLLELVRGCFRLQGKAATIRSSLPLRGLVDCKYESIPFVDATDKDSLRRALEGIDRALVVTPQDYKDGLQYEAIKSINMIQVAKEVGVKRVIHIGSWTVNAPTELPILASRFVPTEEYLRSEIGSDMEWTVLRGGYFMNNFVHVHGNSIRSRQELLAVPDCHIPLVDVTDIGEAAAALLVGDHDEDYAAHYDQRFIECCGPQHLSHSEIAQELSAGIGISIHYPLNDWTNDNLILAELYKVMANDNGQRLPSDPEPLTNILRRPLITLQQWAKENKHTFT